MARLANTSVLTMYMARGVSTVQADTKNSSTFQYLTQIDRHTTDGPRMVAMFRYEVHVFVAQLIREHDIAVHGYE